MLFSTNEKEAIDNLYAMLDELHVTLEDLGEDIANDYLYLKKVKNILSSKDPKGMNNVKKHLMMDFRVIDDRQLEGDNLDDSINQIYNYICSNDIFNKNK